jgi:hypothetical protein
MPNFIPLSVAVTFFIFENVRYIVDNIEFHHRAEKRGEMLSMKNAQQEDA